VLYWARAPRNLPADVGVRAALSLPRPAHHLSDSQKRSRRITPKATWALPLAYWQDEVARARDRSADLAPRPGDPGELSEDVENRTLHELALTFEELQVAEAELRAQNEELQDSRSLIESERARYAELFLRAPAPFVVTDAYGNITQANASAAALLGAGVGRLQGKPLVVFARSVSRRRLRTAIDSIRRGEEEVTLRVNLATRRGTVVHAEVSVVALRNLDGESGDLLWLIVDRTRHLRREARRRRRAEQLEQLVAERTAELERAQQFKDQLIATVSHEFRTALSAIGGYAELLETGIRGPMSGAQQADVRRIQSAYHHLAALVDDLLSYTRLERGKLELVATDIVLSELLRAASELVGPQARERGVSVRIPPVPDYLMLRADAERVRQIVLNLLANAVKFAPPGGAVWISGSATDNDILIEVHDDGPGIPAESIEEIFRPFVRLKTPSPTAGSGLGLAISRDLARAMQGDLTVTSEIGLGSRFVLRLPRKIPGRSDTTTG
jgi:PAS domain S-box-containing protein